MPVILRCVATAVVATGAALLTGACGGSTGAIASAPSPSSTSAAPTASGAAATHAQSPNMSAMPATPATPVTPATSALPTTPAPLTGTAVPVAATGPANFPVDLQPRTAAPGDKVMVYGLTCSAETGTATSAAFTDSVGLSMLSNAAGGEATVRSALAAGRYTVTVTCGGRTLQGTLTVS